MYCIDVGCLVKCSLSKAYKVLKSFPNVTISPNVLKANIKIFHLFAFQLARQLPLHGGGREMIYVLKQ